jgi:hypothetical protein
VFKFAGGAAVPPNLPRSAVKGTLKKISRPFCLFVVVVVVCCCKKERRVEKEKKKKDTWRHEDLTCDCEVILWIS